MVLNGDAAVEAAVDEINRLDALLSTGNEDSESWPGSMPITAASCQRMARF
ncbi:MAG: hypothetical protein ACLR1V_01050 [Coprococcus sp.]